MNDPIEYIPLAKTFLVRFIKQPQTYSLELIWGWKVRSLVSGVEYYKGPTMGRKSPRPADKPHSVWCRSGLHPAGLPPFSALR